MSKPATIKPDTSEDVTPRAVTRRWAARRFPIVGISASAGGLEAVTKLLQCLPPDSGMAFGPVQPLDPTHDSAVTTLPARPATLRPPLSRASNRRKFCSRYAMSPRWNKPR